MKRIWRRLFWRWMKPDIPPEYQEHWDAYGELPSYARYEGCDDC